MKTIHQETINTLHHLIEICKDGREGFKTAAEKADDAELRARFEEYSQQRGEFARELRERAQVLGDDGREGPSATGALHRGWINLKSAVATNEPHAVLAECERGEDAAVEAYREAMNSGHLDPDTRRLIVRHYTGVKAAHDRVKMLRDSPAYQKA